MGRKNSTGNRYLRQGRRSTSGTNASGLLGASGKASSKAERAVIEQLEPRQMLFSLSVTADSVDPNTGIGTVRAFFGYALPIFDSNFVPGTALPTTDSIDFTQINPGTVASGQFLPTQGGSVRLVHNLIPVTDVSIQPPTTQATDRWLRVSPDQAGEFLTFSPFGQLNAQTNQRPIVTTTQATFQIQPDNNDNTGIDTDRTIVELLLNNQVITSFTGTALRNTIVGGNPALGTGTFTFNNPSGFDSVRIRSTTDTIQANPAYQIRAVTFLVLPGNFDIASNSAYGAVAVLSGPVGATANFTDLYGREIIQTIATGKPSTGGTVANIDANDDGIPGFNDGIGAIRLTGTDSRTAFTLWGTQLAQATSQAATADFFQNGFQGTIAPTVNGLLDMFEGDGLGFISRTQTGQVTVSGLPSGPGSVVVGSPWVRDNTNTQTYNPGRRPAGLTDTVRTGFTRADQGIFVDGGSIGSVFIDGILFGSSRVQGAVDKFYASYLLGSLSVSGDAGQLIFGTDAGQWTPDPGFMGNPNTQVDEINKTGSQITIGRTVGEIAIAGRSLVDITVIGDLSSPVTRPARDNVNYYEREYISPFVQAVQEVTIVRQNINNTNFVTRQPTDLFRGPDQAVPFGSTWYRNDGILGAEWVGSASSAVTIRGELSGSNVTSAEDRADVFAFASDGTQDIVVEGSLGNGSPYFRIVDQDGRTLAAPQQTFAQQSGQGNARFGVTQVRYRPTGPGVYYVVVSDPNGNDPNFADVSYAVNISGMATTTLGSYRTGAGSGFTDLNTATGGSNSITVLNGSIGSVRVGTGIVDGTGATIDPTGYINTNLTVNNVMTYAGGAISTPGNLYNITAGSDIGGPGGANAASRILVRVGGNLGTVITGISPAAGVGVNQGDLNFIDFNVGGRIAAFDIRGGIGVDQDETNPRGVLGVNIVNITTGTSGGPGDIGQIRVGFHVAGDALNISTSPGSIIGTFLVSQDSYDDADPRSGIFFGQTGVRITTGIGSDVRFVDTPRLDLAASVDSRLDLIGSTPVTIIDDGGARVEISIANAPDGVFVGSVRVIPIDGAQGVAIASISVDLAGGRVLNISPSATGGGGGGGGTIPGDPSSVGTVSIGRIVLTNSDPLSRIQINGNVKVDVYRITGVTAGGGGGGAGGGSALDTIINSTPGGDIVAIDVDSINTIDVDGNLGTTLLPAWGPNNYGVFLGVAGTLSGTVGGVIGFDSVNGQIDVDAAATRVYRPINDDNFNPGNAFFDDVGAPFDPYLNGVIVRGGNVQEVRAKGSIGDVVLEGAAAALLLLNANNDSISPFNSFQGVTGTIYAFDLVDIQVGDGLTANTAPLATSGIFSINDINQIRSSRATGAVLSGVVSASNANPNDKAGVAADGINDITINSGSVFNAFIAVQNIDSFWTGFNYGDDNRSLGRIANINLRTTNLSQSEISAATLGDINITGLYDASVVQVTGTVGNIRASLGFQNSSLDGDLLGIRRNLILAGQNIESITTPLDIADLTVTALGDIRASFTATNLLRSTINVANEIRGFSITHDVRATSLTAGSVPTVTIGNNLQSSNFTVSGNINTLTAGNRISDSIISVTGPDGAIGTITALTSIAGSISASGPIGTISVTAGDLTASIRTIGSRGNVTLLSAAAGSVAVNADVSGNIGSIVAGRDIGDRAAPGVILVRGDLTSAAAPNGQLYSDLRVSGSIGTVTLGGGVAKPGNNQLGIGSIVAFRTIGTVTVAGDFAGSILSYTGGIGSVAITNGSFLSGAMIGAYDGNIAALTITNGSLYGNVFADFDITSLQVVAGVDGIFGDIGINPASSAVTSVDSRRNQLPPGITPDSKFQGPSVVAGRNITSVVVTNGSVFESSFFARRAIKSISINGDVRNDDFTGGTGSFFAAGDSIDAVTVTGNTSHAAFLSGVVTLGNDNRPGGIGVNADIIKSGNIALVSINGSTSDTTFSAGINAGADGIYNTGDDTTAQGLSTITTLNLGGNVNNVSAFGDTLSGSVNGDNRLNRGGTNLPNANGQIDNGVGTPGTSFSGSQTFNFGAGTVTITVAGPGQSFFNTGSGVLTIRNGTGATNVTVRSSTGSLNNFDIVTNDDASLGNITFQSTALTGDSDIIVDVGVGVVTFGDYSGTGSVTVGEAGTSFTFASFTGGTLTARSAATIRVNGDFATSPGSTKPTINLLTGGAISVGGRSTGTISSDRDLTSVTLSGAVSNTNVRAGSTLGAFTASAGIASTVVSAGNVITTVSIVGDASRSSIAAGVDLGSDAFFGGTGQAGDVVSTGTLGTVTISGNIPSTSITAGFHRGPDGFFGSADDNVAPGRSTVGAVTIGGTVVGSNRNTESYRIESTGTLGTVTFGGQIVALGQNVGVANFLVAAPAPIPQPLRVNDLIVSVAGNTYSANIIFNQAVDVTTLSRSLNVAEIRGGAGQTFISLVEGSDYTVTYDNSTFTAIIRFSRNITSQNLPQTSGRPGPGVFRFRLSSSIIRPQLVNQLIDGDGNGFVSSLNDDYIGDAQIGDAGDKITAGITTTTGGTRVDFYGPVNLNTVLDDKHAADGLAQTNVTTTIRGFIGDHPDTDINFFRLSGDTDVYQVTLQAGQILQLGALSGAANRAGLTLLSASGVANQIITANNDVTSLPVPTGDNRQLSFPSTFLIRTTGTFFIVVGNAATVTNTATVNNPEIAQPSTTGDYTFTINIFDDGDSGFTSTTNAGDGTPVINAPPASQFAGTDGVFGTPDDPANIIVGNFNFTLNRGLDGLPNTADDIVSGKDNTGITSTRDSSGTLTSTINGAIGPAGHVGIPTDIFPDADIFHLNNRQAIAPGTHLRIAVRLTDLGSILGSADAVTNTDNRGTVQFGLFDTSNSGAVDDASLVFSPTDFKPFGGTPNTIIATNGSTTYGYDNNGDFFIDFIAPSRLGQPGAAGTFAVYLQGSNNTDYQIVVTTAGTGQSIRAVQNVFLETQGGTIGWLETGRRTTSLSPLDVRSLGFAGDAVNGQSLQDFVVSSLVSALNSTFQDAGSFNGGLAFRFSSNPADFEGQPFSTIFLTSTTDPVSPLFDPFNSFNFNFLSNAFVNTQPYGYSQHSDPLNADISDEGVVFIPALALQGFGGGTAGANQLVQSLTGAVGRRVGELVGLRVSGNNGTGATTFDALAADSITNRPGAGRGYTLPNFNRLLSSNFDAVTRTDFFLGRQNARSLLDQVIQGL